MMEPDLPADPSALREIRIELPRLDAAAAPDARRDLAPRMEGRPSRLLLDMTGVSFVDSTGLGVLVSLLKMMGQDGKVAVAGAQPVVQRLFEMTQLDRLFQLHPTVAQARESLGG